ATGWLSMAGFRAVLGLSEAVAIPTGTKVSTIWFPSQERSIATGWFNSGSSIGSMITPPLVIWLASVYGWRPAFLITGTLGVLLGIVWFWLYRDPEAHRTFLRTSAPTSPPAGNPGGDQTLGRRDSVKDEVPRHHHRPFPDRAGLADLRVLDSPLH